MWEIAPRGSEGLGQNLPMKLHACPRALLVLPLFFGCSGDAEDPAVDGASAALDGADETEEAEDEPSPEELLERMRELVSPAEFTRFEENRGLVVGTGDATPGLTLVMPLNSTSIHLVDEAGEIEHTWETDFAPGGWAYLMEDGTLYRSARADEDQRFRGGGIGGILERLGPDGEVLWRHRFADEARCQHHDIEVLENGHLLLISWERQGGEDAVARGRDPRGVGAKGLWSDAVYELKPVGKDGAEIVWSWHAWDHLVQDVDEAKPNFGAVAERPERIDINARFVPPSEISDEERAARAARAKQMAAVGYAGGAPPEEDEEEEEPRDWDRSGDWMHTNAIDHHAELDLIVLSSPEFGEVFVIDHSTTPEQAAGSTGGRYGRGGDLLWRWGNPANHGVGGEGDQRLFYQHDPRWLDVPDGAAPRITIFNNGGERPDGTSFSEILELELPFDGNGFSIGEDGAYGPAEPAWSYADPETFFSAFISGATRLVSGNTIICSGVVGRIFEVTPDGTVVWDYYSPLGGDVEPPDHAGKAPPFSLYRAARYSREHPGITALGLR